MKRRLLIASLLLALVSPAARAATVNLAWGTLCHTENPVSATTFACDTNGPEGDRVMTVSFKPEAALPQVVGLEWLIVGRADPGAPLPDWWRLGAAPDCRAGEVAFRSD
jgi:hypothetical protein